MGRGRLGQAGRAIDHLPTIGQRPGGDFILGHGLAAGAFTKAATSCAARVSTPDLLKKPRSRIHWMKRSCQVPSPVKSRYCRPAPWVPRASMCISTLGMPAFSMAVKYSSAHTAWTLSCQPAPAMKEGGASLGIGGTPFLLVQAGVNSDGPG